LAVATLALAGCGGDDESADETTPALPDLTVPRGDTGEEVEPAPAPAPEPETAPQPNFETETLAPPETAPPSTGGGTPAPESEPPPDTPENDAPPPEGSPAERFEEFCNENPGACG
jgi:hypothetical protein